MSQGQLQQGRNADWDLDEFTGEALVKVKELQVRYEPLGDIAYFGKAVFGSATSAAVWQIRKIDYSIGVVILAAGGNAEFDKVWDNRTGLIYS